MEPRPANVGRARRCLHSELSRWGDEDVTDTAVLLASELITNAILHAGTRLELRAGRTGDRLRVEVRDERPPRQRLTRAPGESTTGQGLFLMDALAGLWGVEPDGGGKVVWFELEVGSQRRGARSRERRRRTEGGPKGAGRARRRATAHVPVEG